MAGAASEFVGWMQAVALGAEETAGRVRLAVAAFEEAFAAVVPPSVVAANRLELASLVAGNVFGQNSALIGVNQAEYGQMAAQDVAAMSAYAAASAAATVLPSFPPPPQTTKSAAARTQAAPAAAAPGPLTQLAQSIVDNPTVQGLNRFLNLANAPIDVLANGTVEAQLEYMMAWPALTGAATANVGYAGSLGLIPAGLASSVSEGASGVTVTGSSTPVTGTPGVSASLGKAMPVGQLSAPRA